jgi:hypothetical protein
MCEGSGETVAVLDVEVLRRGPLVPSKAGETRWTENGARTVAR